MLLNKIIQRDYTSFSLYYQIKLPLDLEISIPSDDPVRLAVSYTHLDVYKRQGLFDVMYDELPTPKPKKKNKQLLVYNFISIYTKQLVLGLTAF